MITTEPVPTRSRAVVALALAVLVGIVGSAGAGDLSDMLPLIVDAYGGPGVLKRFDTFRVEAEVEATMRGKQGTTKRDFMAPDRFFVEVVYPDGVERRYLDGPRAWRGTGDAIHPVNGPPRLAMVYQMLRTVPAATLSRFASRLELRGNEIREGVSYTPLALPWSPDLELVFLVNPATFLVEQVEGTIRVSGREIGFATRYREFNEAYGVVFPQEEENYAAGRRTGTTRIKRLIFSPKDPGPFSPP